MIHLQWETTASPEGDAVSPARDLLASPNFGICDATPLGSVLTSVFIRQSYINKQIVSKIKKKHFVTSMTTVIDVKYFYLTFFPILD
jgi:hypothetical protein